MLDFLKRLFALRNLAPIVVILGAVIASLNVKPFGVQIPADQAIMALLAFLAIDALVERIDLLSRIQQDVQMLKTSMMPSASSFFKHRRDTVRVEEWIEQAQNEVWVAGIVLDTITSLRSFLEARLHDGCTIRILALDPEGIALQAMADFIEPEPKVIAGRIESNLRLLVKMGQDLKDGLLHVRVTDHICTTGCLIVDPKSRRGRMSVQLYTYRTYVDNAPLFQLDATRDAEWFSFFVGQFEKVWSESHDCAVPKNLPGGGE